MLDIWGLHHIQRALIGCLVLALGLGGCASSLPPLPAPVEHPPLSGMGEGPRPTPAMGHTLGPGDVLRVSVYDNPDLSQEVTIEADGAFSYPLIGRVQAAGLPVPQLEGLLAKRLADGYLVSPQVGVTVTQHKSQQVYVMGAVSKPGPYALQRQTTLLEALSAAGGPTPDAGFEVILTHAADKRALPSGTSKVSAAANGQPALRVSLEQLMAGGCRSVLLCRMATWSMCRQRPSSTSQARSSVLVGIVWRRIPPSRRPSPSLAGLPNLLPPRV